jgi:DNA-binding Lrp family transcriptional regulator
LPRGISDHRGTYANIFGLVERFIAAKVLDVSRAHWLGDQTALEALVRFGDEEIKHQELFRRIERMCAEGMPKGYTFVPEPNAVASAVLAKSTWAVLALTCHIELFVLAHYRESIETDANVSELWKDVFLYHWKEESQHAILDELEWVREDAKLTPEARDAAVDDLIALVGAVDGILQAQSAADAYYFIEVCGRPMTAIEVEAVKATVLAAYRWQYIVSGVQIPRFSNLLNGMITPAQRERIGAALVPLMA